MIHDTCRHFTQKNFKAGHITGKEKAWAGTEWTDITCCRWVLRCCWSPNRVGFHIMPPPVIPTALRYSEPLTLHYLYAFPWNGRTTQLPLGSADPCSSKMISHSGIEADLQSKEASDREPQAQGHLLMYVEVAYVKGFGSKPWKLHTTHNRVFSLPQPAVASRKLTTRVLSL